MRTQIFISYRREDGLAAARAIEAGLRDTYEVFFDMESLRNGRFDLSIEEAIGACTDFLLILSPSIFNRINADGDWISRELQLALRHNKNIIPIFLEGFKEPECDSELIKTVLCYNGIPFSLDADFFERLSLFLLSQKRCLLRFGCENGGYRLLDESVEALKEVYRKTVDHKEYGVHISLALPDEAEAAELLVPSELDEESALMLLPSDTDKRDRATALAVKKQRLIQKRRSHSEAIETAIELMIGDVVNVDIGYSSLRDEPLEKEFFQDKDGGVHTYHPVCVWVHVIEELIKEITTDHANKITEYSNTPGYSRIECTIDHVFKNEKGDWYFKMCIPAEHLDKPIEHYYFMKPQVTSLPSDVIIRYVLPSFYYKLALELKHNKNDRFISAILDPESDVRALFNYWYGIA